MPDRTRPLGALVLAVLLVVQAAAAQRLAEIGPAPRDGGRFVNTVGAISHASLAVRLPFVVRRLMGSVRKRSGASKSVADPARALRLRMAEPGDFALWIGHSTLLIRMGETVFLTDPVWSAIAGPGGRVGAQRLADPAVPIEALPPLDFVLISHNHYDHLDLATLEALARQRPPPRILLPLANRRTLRRIEGLEIDELDWGEWRDVADLRVVCLPAQHWSRRGLFDAMRGLWSSWAVGRGTKRFYFGGDSGLFGGFSAIGQALGPFALAALPIGAYEPAVMMKPFHLDPEEALVAAEHLLAERVVGIHFGTFDLTDEPLEEPARRFLEAAGASERWRDRASVLPIGGALAF